MKLLNGKDLSGQLEAELKNNVDNLKAKGVQPCLVAETKKSSMNFFFRVE